MRRPSSWISPARLAWLIELSASVYAARGRAEEPAPSAGAQGSNTPVVWYRATDACPSAPAFLEKLTAKSRTARLATGGEHIDFVVSLVENAGEIVGSYDFASGTVTTLASGLDGPVGIGVTDSHVFVLTDGAPLIGAVTHLTLWRAPLGGALEQPQDGATLGDSAYTLSQSFVGVGTFAFWGAVSGTYEMSGEAGASPTLFGEAMTYVLTRDATDIYYVNAKGTWHVPVAGGTAQAIAGCGMAAKSGVLYGAVPQGEIAGAGMMLQSGGGSGGSCLNVRALGSDSPGATYVSGDRFVVGLREQISYPFGNHTGAMTVTLGSEPPTRLLASSTRRRVWAGTPNAFFWSFDREIHMRSLAGL